MGIKNRDGALYFATGLDNTGLYSGKREAVGIIKALAGEITSFDVFGGIGISASIAFARAAKDAYNFEKQFQQSMKEVATLSSGIKGSLADFMNQVVEITKTVPVQANDAAKALYQIVSAGHDGADAMKILEVSAKAAIGGTSDVLTSADAITTILNAYKMSASEAENVSDMLFTTAKLGKTTMGELGQSIAQAAPIAASYGVEIDQVLAAVATLTKQGTPTAQAMTQIRASIVGVSKVLGDGAFEVRTYQEALEEVARRAAGSESKLRELVPEIEAVNGVLGLTGKNAQEAAGHLGEMQDATGTAEVAFKEMASSAENQMRLLGNNVTAALRPLGEGILKEISSAAESMNKAFENGSAQQALKDIGALIVVVTTALAGYKGSILAVSAAKQIYATVTALVNKQRAIEAADLVLTKGLYAIEATMIAKNTSSRVLLTQAIKTQTITQLKNAAAMLTSPYVLAAAAFAALGYAIYNVATSETVAEKVHRRFNDSLASQKQQLDALKSSAIELINTIKSETSTQYDKMEAYLKLQNIMPEVFKNMDIEKIKLMDLVTYENLLSEAKNRREIVGAKTNLVLKTNAYNEAKERYGKTSSNNSNVLKYYAQMKEAEEEVKLAQKQVDDILRIQEKAKESIKPVEIKLLEAKNNRGQIEQEYAAAKLVLEEEQRKIKESGFGIIPIDVQIRFNNAEKSLNNIDSVIKGLMGSKSRSENQADVRNEAYWKKKKEDAETELKALSDIEAAGKKGLELKKKITEYDKRLESFSTSNKQVDSAANKAEELRKQKEQYKLLIDKQKLDQKRAEEDASNEVTQTTIDKEEDRGKKVLMQRELNHKKEIEAIQREAEDKKREILEKERAIFEANPANKKKTFNADVYAKTDVAKKQFKSIDDVAVAQKETVNIKYDRGDDLKDILDKYQNFNRQRLTLEKEYQEDERILQDRMLKAKTEDEKKQIQESMDELAKCREKAIQEISKNEIEESGIWKQLMGNFDAIPTDSLEKLLSDAEQLVKSTNLSAVEMQAMMKTINDARQNLISRNPFKTLKEEYEKYKKAVKAGDNEGASTSWSNVEQATESIKNNISTLGSALSGLASTFSDDVSNGIQKAVSAINDGVTAFEVFGKKGEKSAGDTIKGISGIVGIITTLVGTLLDAFDNSKEIQERNIEYQRRQEGYWDSINYQVERYLKLLEQAAGNEYFETSANALSKLNEARDKAYKDIIPSMPEGDVDHTTFGLAQLFNTGKFHNKFSEANSGVSKEIFDFINANGGYDLQNKIISEDAIFAMKNNADIWSKLPSWMQDAIDKFIEYNEQAEELKEKLNEDLFQTTSKGIEDAILNGLKEGKRGLEDFGNSFEEIMRNALLQSFVIDQLRGKAQEFYKKYTELADSDGDGKLDLTADEIKKLREDWNIIVSAATEEANKIDEIVGSSSSTSQDSTQKGFQSMSQETGSELNGRFTALQISGEEIKNQAITQTGIQDSILQKLEFLCDFSYTSTTEMHDMMGDIADYLYNIKKDTSHLYFMRESLNKIENNTKSLSSR